ncbi:MAG: LysM peptidoglycan-binding domain-containing protein [Actinobacteria bacterium]|nr:LysM peptidoglycan-binding domain-containing protein [Actinomycetota bacterium]
MAVTTTDPQRSVRNWVLVLGTTVLLPLAAAACAKDGTSNATLPPLVTLPPSTTIDTSTSLPLVTVYIVQAGDSLLRIANAFNVDLDQMMMINGITDKNHVEVGQAIKIPPQRIVITELPTSASTTVAP